MVSVLGLMPQDFELHQTNITIHDKARLFMSTFHSNTKNNMYQFRMSSMVVR